MKTLRRLTKAVLIGTSSAVLVFGVMTATAEPAEAGGPILLCGPTLTWSCEGIGGPSFKFIGTVCEKNRYEHNTHRTCVPIGTGK